MLLLNDREKVQITSRPIFVYFFRFPSIGDMDGTASLSYMLGSSFGFFVIAQRRFVNCMPVTEKKRI